MWLVNQSLDNWASSWWDSSLWAWRVELLYTTEWWDDTVSRKHSKPHTYMYKVQFCMHTCNHFLILCNLCPGLRVIKEKVGQWIPWSCSQVEGLCSLFKQLLCLLQFLVMMWRSAIFRSPMGEPSLGWEQYPQVEFCAMHFTLVRLKLALLLTTSRSSLLMQG